MSNRRKVRLIHTSDTHLGDRWGHPIAAAAFEAVVDAAPRLGGEALLIVGDVFDHARVPDAVLEFFVSQVARLTMPVIVLPGNHDLYDESSLYLREPFRRQPANLHILRDNGGELLLFPHLTLEVWGRAMRSHTPEFRPLVGMPAARNGQWRVALAHAHFHEEGEKELRSSPIHPHEVAAAPCDYLALGHWDRHTEVSRGAVTAVYSGAPLGAWHDPIGAAVTVVELDPAAGVRFWQEPIRVAVPEGARRKS